MLREKKNILNILVFKTDVLSAPVPCSSMQLGPAVESTEVSRFFLHIRSFIMPTVSSRLQSSCHSLHLHAFCAIFLPLHSEHFVSPCHLYFFICVFFSTRGNYSIHQTEIHRLSLLNLWLYAFLSVLDSNISFLSRFAPDSFSFCLFSLNLPTCSFASPPLPPVRHIALCCSVSLSKLPLYALLLLLWSPARSFW